METINLRIERADNGWIIEDTDEGHLDVVEDKHSSINEYLGNCIKSTINEVLDNDCDNQVYVKMQIETTDEHKE